MTDTNTNVPADDKNTAPVAATNVAPAEENKAEPQNAATTEVKTEEKKAV